MIKSQKGTFLPVIGLVILVLLIGFVSYYLGVWTRNQSSINIKTDLTENLSKESDPNSPAVRIVYGDIVVSENGLDKKITDWGYNFSPALSPSGKKIAYISKTKESFENVKKYQGYVPSSTNIWIIDKDGSNPVQITNHDNWIFRDNLLWLSDDRLLYTDGTNSVKVYSLDDKKTVTVMGPEKPEPVCVDACGAGSKFIFSPENKYLILLSEDGEGGVAVAPQSSILDIQLLKPIEIKQKFAGIDYAGLKFNKDKTISFPALVDGAQKMQEITVDLVSGRMSF